MKTNKPNVGLMIGLGMLKSMLNKKLISESEYNNMVKEFTKQMNN
jgi:hypothetical protein